MNDWMILLRLRNVKNLFTLIPFVSVSLSLAIFFYPLRSGTSEVDALPPLPEVPEFTKVIHPNGFDFSDVEAIFLTAGAPARETLIDCDESYNGLVQATQSKLERDRGLREMVQKNPIHYHWCFYSKILDLHAQLKKEQFLADRQKKVVGAFSFLAPLANVFKLEYNDTRYLRWAIYDYQVLSTWIFHRQMVMAPATVDRLLDGMENSRTLYREPSQNPGVSSGSVLEKYNLKTPERNEAAGSSNPEGPLPEAVPADQPLDDLPDIGDGW